MGPDFNLRYRHPLDLIYTSTVRKFVDHAQFCSRPDATIAGDPLLPRSDLRGGRREIYPRADCKLPGDLYRLWAVPWFNHALMAAPRILFAARSWPSVEFGLHSDGGFSRITGLVLYRLCLCTGCRLLFVRASRAVGLLSVRGSDAGTCFRSARLSVLCLDTAG